MGKKEGFDDSIIGNDIVQFQFYNKIDTTILQKIDKEVERYKKKGRSKFVFNMEGIKNIGTMVVGQVTETIKHVENNNGRFVFINLEPKVKSFLLAFNTSIQFKFFTSLDDLLKYFADVKQGDLEYKRKLKQEQAYEQKEQDHAEEENDTNVYYPGKGNAFYITNSKRYRQELIQQKLIMAVMTAVIFILHSHFFDKNTVIDTLGMTACFMCEILLLLIIIVSSFSSYNYGLFLTKIGVDDTELTTYVDLKRSFVKGCLLRKMGKKFLYIVHGLLFLIMFLLGIKIIYQSHFYIFIPLILIFIGFIISLFLKYFFTIYEYEKKEFDIDVKSNM